MATYKYTSPSGSVYQFEGPEELTPELQQKVRDHIALDESDTNQGPLATFGNATMQGLAQTATGVVGGAGAVINTLTGSTGEDRSGLSTWADEMQQGAELNFPTNPANPIATGLGQAVGQGVGMMGTSALGLPLGSAKTVARLGLGMAGLMGAQQGEQVADEFGITDPLKRAAMVGGFGAIEGATEAFGGIGSTKFAKSLLKDVPSVLESGIEPSAIKRGLNTAFGEGLEEVGSGELQDITTVALASEDPNNPGYSLNGQPLPELASMSTLQNRGQEFLFGMAGGLVPGGVNAAFGTSAGDVMEYRQAVAEKRRDGKVLPEEDERVTQLDTKAQEYLRKAGISDEKQAFAILAHLLRADKTRNVVVEAAKNAVVDAPQVAESLGGLLHKEDLKALDEVANIAQSFETKPVVEEEKPLVPVKVEPETPVLSKTDDGSYEGVFPTQEDADEWLEKNKESLSSRTRVSSGDKHYVRVRFKDEVNETPPPAAEEVSKSPLTTVQLDTSEEPPPAREPVVEEPPPAREPVVEEPPPAREPVVEEPPPAREPVVEEPPPAREPVVEEVAMSETYEPEPLPPGAQIIQKQQSKSTVAKGRYPVVIYKGEDGKMQQRAHFTNDPNQTFNQIAAGQEISVPQGTKVHPDIKVSEGKVVGVNRSVNGSVRLIENQEQADAAARDDTVAALRSEIQRDTPEVKAAKDAARVAVSGVLPEFPGESTFVDQTLLDRIKTIAARVPRLDTVARENLESDILAKLVAVKRAGAFIESQLGETMDEKKLAALAAPEVKGNRQLESIIRNYDATQEANLSYIQSEVNRAKADTSRSVQTESLDAPESGVTEDVAAPTEEAVEQTELEEATKRLEEANLKSLEEATKRLEGIPDKIKDTLLSNPENVTMINGLSDEKLAKLKAQLTGAKAERIKAGYRSVRSIMEESDRLGLKDGQPKSILTALQRIADNKTGDNYHPHIVYVARALSKLIGSLSEIQDLRFGTANTQHAATYRASDHSITLNLGTPWGEQQTVGEILVHEVGHALTSIKLNDPQTEYDKALANEIESMRQQISEYLTNVRPADAESFAYQLSNADEFVAGVFSNPPFVEMLASLPERLVAGTPVSTKSNFFTNLLRKLWNLMLGKSVTPGSPMERAMDAVFSLAETPFTIPTAENVLSWASIEKNFPAYHGTPHTVDRFSTEKVGTGEGAQAFGWGLYFAESRDVGEGYRDKLAQWTLLTSDGKIYDDRKELKNLNVRAVLNKNGSIDEAVARARSVIESIPGTQGAELALADIATLEKLKQSGGLTKTKGNLYTVEILPNEAEFLDWDKPLSEQSEKVKAALSATGLFTQRDLNPPANFVPSPLFNSGRGAYDIIKADAGSPQKASQRLSSLGVAGIKYFDGNSRNIEYGTRNFVIFNDKDVKITHVNGTQVTEHERSDFLDQHLNAAAAPSSKESLPGEHRELIVEAMRALPAGYTLNTDTTSDSPVWVRRSRPGVVFANPGILAAEVAGMNPGRRAELLRSFIEEEVAHTEDLKELGDDEARRIARELAPETRAWINDMYGQDLNDIETVFEGFRMLRQRMRNGATTEEIRAFAASDPNFARRFLEYLRRMWKRLMANLDQDKTLANIKAVRSLVGGIDTLESLAVGMDDTKLGADQDSAYLELAKDPEANREQLQRMVDEAARTAGYSVGPFWHTSREKQTRFLEYLNDPTSYGVWFFTPQKESLYSKGRENLTKPFFLKLKNPIYLPPADTPDLTRSFANKNPEYDGAISFRNPSELDEQIYSSDNPEASGGKYGVYEVVSFRANQIKSADPVTYDENGKVIPLSQRFNQDSDSILRASPWAWIRDQVKPTAGTVTSHRTKAPWFATQDENTPYAATGVMFGSGRKNVSIAEAERVKNAINTAEGRALTVLDRDIKAAAVKTMGSWDAAKALVGEALGNNENRMDYDQRIQYERDHIAAAKAALATYQSELGAVRALENQGDYAGAATLKQAAQSKFKTEVSLAKDDFDHKIAQAEQLARQQALAKQAAAMAALPTELREAVQRARDRMDALTTEFINKGYGSDDLRATLSKNLGLYLHRSYSAFDSPHWAQWVMGKNPEAVRLRNKVETLIKVDLTAKKAAELIKANSSLSQQDAINQAEADLNTDAGLHKIQAELQSLLENSPDEFTSLVQGDGFKNGKPSSVIKRRGEIHPWIQEFWGKHDDPLLNISKSIGLTHTYLAQQSMLRSILNDGVRDGYIFDDVGKAKGLVALKDMKSAEDLRKYPSLFRKDANGKIIGEWFVSPLVRDAIQDLEPKADTYGPIWNVFRSLTGYSMAAKTVYSPMALVRDFLSNITLLTIHGHMTPGFAAGPSTWAKSLSANAREVGIDRLLQAVLSPVRGNKSLFSDKQAALFDKLHFRTNELGVTGNIMVNEVVKELTKESSKRFELRGKDVNRLVKAIHSGLSHTADSFAETRALSDDIPKMVAWINEVLRLSKFHPNMTQEEAEVRAAEKVRMYMPSQSETSDLIKLLRKQPFAAPFITFSGEIVRTMFNTYKLGAQEMKSDSVGEKLLGFHRIAGMTAMITVLPALIQSAVSKFRPEDDPPVKTDELSTALPRFVSDWQKDNMLLWMGKEGNKHTYLDLSYLAPYDLVHGILSGTARELFTNPDNVTIPGKVGAALEKVYNEAAKPVAKEQLLFGAIVDTLRNQRDPGDKFGLYNDRLATGWEKWTARLNNFWQQALEPGIVKSARGIMKGINQEVDSSGRAYETGNEIRSLFGAKTMSQDIPTRLMRNGNGYARDLSDATMYASQPFSSAGTQDDEALIKAFARMNEAKLKVVGEIRKDWLAAQALGMTAEEATKSLTISHLPKDAVAAAISNEYVREPLSKQLLEKAATNGQALGQDRMALYRRAVEAYPAKQKVLPY
jgi:hypothetical protein